MRACRCKNYPKYNSKDALACFAECGGAAQEIAPACPAIGVLGTSGPAFDGRNYGTATSCCGAPSPHCANKHFDERQHGDWCASSNHVHFDLDYDSAAVLCGTDKPNNCIITKLEPVSCAPANENDHELALAGPPPCTVDEDCSLNGQCQASGACQCFAPWTGADCGVLDVLPSPRRPAYGGGNETASWGASAVRGPNGDYHLFVAEMTEGCGLLDWQTNMQVAHAVASVPAGPYAKQAAGGLPALSMNPEVVVDEHGEYWMFHVGLGGGSAGPGKNCSANGTAAAAGAAAPRNWHNVVHRASQPGGPWVAQPSVECNNPTALLGSDGLYRLLCTWQLYTSRAGFGGPWSAPVPVPGMAANATAAAGAGDRRPRARWEDPFLWQDRRGHYHVLAHAFLDGGGTCGGADPHTVTAACNYISGHAFSRDGLGNWTASPTEPYSFAVAYDDGSHGLLSTRERPKLLFDESSGEPTHLFTAVAPMPPAGCASCTNPRKGRDAKACIGCKTCAPWDLQVYTMVTPLRI